MTSLVIAVAHVFGALANEVVGAISPSGGAPGGASAWLLLATILGAATLLAVAVVLVAACFASVPDARRRPLPRQNADLPTLIAQSNPAAPGHVRARAPSLAARPA